MLNKIFTGLSFKKKPKKDTHSLDLLLATDKPLSVLLESNKIYQTQHSPHGDIHAVYLGMINLVNGSVGVYKPTDSSVYEFLTVNGVISNKVDHIDKWVQYSIMYMDKFRDSHAIHLPRYMEHINQFTGILMEVYLPQTQS